MDKTVNWSKLVRLTFTYTYGAGLYVTFGGGWLDGFVVASPVNLNLKRRRIPLERKKRKRNDKPPRCCPL